MIGAILWPIAHARNCNSQSGQALPPRAGDAAAVEGVVWSMRLRLSPRPMHTINVMLHNSKYKDSS